MTLDEILDYYGNSYQFWKKSRMSITNIHNWRRQKCIPMVSQGRLELLTNGGLKARTVDSVPHDDTED